MKWSSSRYKSRHGALDIDITWITAKSTNRIWCVFKYRRRTIQWCFRGLSCRSHIYKPFAIGSRTSRQRDKVIYVRISPITLLKRVQWTLTSESNKPETYQRSSNGEAICYQPLKLKVQIQKKKKKEPKLIVVTVNVPTERHILTVCKFYNYKVNVGPTYRTISTSGNQHWAAYRFKYTTKFSLPKIACPAIVYAKIVIDLFFVGVCPWIKVYRYNPTESCQQRLQGVRNVAQKLCSWERSLNKCLTDTSG